jgi:hypothetical protein
MPRPRKTLASPDATPYYHCSSRCVRRAFLCGKDKLTGQSFEHRRQWIEDKLLELASIFAIDLWAYAEMHNHYHVVLFIDKNCVEHWSEFEVVEHWHQLFGGNTYSQCFLNGESLSVSEQANLSRSIGLWRARLMNISWFMRILNDKIIWNNFEQLCWPRRSEYQDDTNSVSRAWPTGKITVPAGCGRVASQARHYSMKKH